jgi:hypothetical protein
MDPPGIFEISRCRSVRVPLENPQLRVVSICGLWAPEDELRYERQREEFLNVAFCPFGASEWLFSLWHPGFLNFGTN